MYANAKAGYFKYQQNDFLNLTPAEVVDRLFKGLFTYIDEAREAMDQNLTARKGEKISRAIAIAGELQASLDMEKGGEISERLYMLYDFVIRELLMANLENSPERLETIKTVIRPVMDGWSQMVQADPGRSVHVVPEDQSFRQNSSPLQVAG